MQQRSLLDEEENFNATVRNASDLPLRDVRLTWYLDNVRWAPW